MKIETDQKLDFKDVLVRPRPSRLASRKDVLLMRTFTFPHSDSSWTTFPLVASNMDATGTFDMAKALQKQGAVAALSKYYKVGELAKFFVSPQSRNTFFSMGITPIDADKLKELKARVPVTKICIEVANGYIHSLPKFISDIRKENPTAIIMAGSVCTPEGTKLLLRAGADIVRVGIGSGSVCITRKVAGVGYPQVSAIIECAEAAREENGLICSDGGCVSPGDVCKAFGAGADLVMLGGMLAGHAECNGKIRYRKRGTNKVPVSMQFYGMASDIAQERHFGGKASYRAAEGKAVEIPYRGRVEGTIMEIMGGLRSMMTYIDAAELAEVCSKTTFIKVGTQLNTVFGH